MTSACSIQSMKRSNVHRMRQLLGALCSHTADMPQKSQHYCTAHARGVLHEANCDKPRRLQPKGARMWKRTPCMHQVALQICAALRQGFRKVLSCLLPCWVSVLLLSTLLCHTASGPASTLLRCPPAWPAPT
jgi:hypothetical protein